MADSKSTLNVDVTLEYLKAGRSTFGTSDQLNINKAEAFIAANAAKYIFEKENLCLEIGGNVTIVGDIFGQYEDLLRIFRLGGDPPNNTYLFLGNYVNFSRFSLETLMLLFLYKIKYPKNIYMLRGNHESKALTSSYGFKEELHERFQTHRVWRAFCETFAKMPICAVVEKTVFCVHGGISPGLLKDSITSGQRSFIRYINSMKPYQLTQGDDLFNMVWADPEDPPRQGSEPFKSGNRGGCTVTYNEAALEKFLKKYQFQKLIRGHQIVKEGYRLYAKNQCLTLFSAPRYTMEQATFGAVCRISSNGKKLNIDLHQMQASQKSKSQSASAVPPVPLPTKVGIMGKCN